MARKGLPVEWLAVEVDINGKRHVGSYSVERGIVEVSGAAGRKRAQLGNTPPRQLAELLLCELVSEAERRPG